MRKSFAISGFPEWLPEQKLVEDRIINTIREVYSSYGFVPIETPAVELLESLSSQGVIEREIYVVKRYHAEEDQEGELGLHFDLTVPFARYAAQHLNDLIFPFKRYQLQKVWRGERPQKGRFREFYQFDIDTIARDELPLSCDAEVVTVLGKAFQAINLGPFQISVNNRKMLLGAFRALGLEEAQAKEAVVAVDKIHKIGRAGVLAELGRQGVSNAVSEKLVDLISTICKPAEIKTALKEMKINEPLFEEGVQELEDVFTLLPPDTMSLVKVDFSLARGLAYYTGALFEVQFTQYPEYGSVGGGGRYSDLASQFINQKLPGVGASIGITRLMDLVFQKNLIPCDKKSLASVLVSVLDEGQRPACNKVAEDLRAHGVSVEVYYKSPKLGKQIEYAEKKGIPYVFFLAADGKTLESKDLKSKQQVPVTDVGQWASSLVPSK